MSGGEKRKLGEYENFLEQPKGFSTKAIRVGQDPDQWSYKPLVPPIGLSTTFKQSSPGEHEGFYYGRSGNPSRSVLEQCLASLDNGKYCGTFASGFGAVTALITLLKTGDHILSGDDIYGGTNRLFRNFAVPMGISVDFADPTNLEKFEKSLLPNTKMVWIETPTNPTLKIVDIKAVADVVHKKAPQAFLAVDNTFLSAYLQRPLDLGADVVMYSLTKYMNGHSDVVMGSVTTNDEKLYERLRFYQIATGIVPSPFDCFLVNRSLKTLALRMERHGKNSLAVAKFLETHPKVRKVLHPGLPSHPQHEVAKRQSYGHSGIMSFYIADCNIKKSKKFLQNLKIFALAESLGGYESLAALPALMMHAFLPEEQRKKLGIDDGLIRISVGLEDQDDLIKDLQQALEFI